MCGAWAAEKAAKSTLQRILSYQISNKQPPSRKYALTPLAHMVESVLGYMPAYEAGNCGKRSWIMAMARPEPLFDWFIPIDGDGVHLGTLTAERPHVCVFT